MSVCREKALNLVRALGIPLYLRDGHLYQHPPGERLEPPVSVAASHGNGTPTDSGDGAAGSPIGSAANAIP